MREPRFYRYIHVDDDGHAPCIDRGMVTLATCKPAIRSTAKVGDWVAGYMPKGLGEGLITWVGRVAETMDPLEYGGSHWGRKDAQYRNLPDGSVERASKDYHPCSIQQARDQGAKVLIFDKSATWYFGDKAAQPPLELDPLKAAGQGHRVNLRIDGDLATLQSWLETIGPPGFYGKPRTADTICGSGCAPPQPRKTVC